MKITIKFSELVRKSNPDMVKQFDEDEKKVFKSQKEVYRFIVSKYGSSAFSIIKMYQDGEHLPEWKLKVK